MDMQKRYWYDMVDCKYQSNYISSYIDYSYKLDNTISIINAIASSVSIAGWAVWNSIPYVWSFIIAASQVITAIKPYLPYGKRLKNLNAYITEASSIYLDYEHNWYKVANGDMTNNEINDKIYDLKRKLDKINNRYLSNVSLPVKKDLESKAEADTDIYFKTFA